MLVGGILNGTTSNKLWVYDNDAWHCSLPPMPTGRKYPVVVNTGTPEYLVVAGGYKTLESDIDIAIEVVEVSTEGQWVSCPPLYTAPVATGALHNGNLYFSFDKDFVEYCQLESLVKACVQPDTGRLWKFLPVPDVYGIVAYGKFLIGWNGSGDLHALSPDTESWVHVGRQDLGRLMTLCTGELAALTPKYEYESLHVKLLSVKGTCP